MLRKNQKNLLRNIHLRSLVLLGIALLILADSGLAESFPFRTLSIGALVPDAQFGSYKGEGTKTIHSFVGKPLLLVFFGGDLAAKKDRAVKSLKIVQEMSPYLHEKGVAVLIVNMQNDPQSEVDEVVTLSGITQPVYKDASRQAYSSLGIYVLPAFLFVDAGGKVSGGIGYSKDLSRRLRGEVDVMTGLISHEKLEADLSPEMKEVPNEQKNAMQHLRMGKVMKHKGMLDSAFREFQDALKLDPALSDARVELGCLHLEKGTFDKAIDELEAGLAANPDAVEAEICLARVRAEKGEVDQAINDLKVLLLRNGRKADLHYTLGTLLERKGDMKGAAESYRKAFDLLQRMTSLHE
jgi:tetratricopeptide (TPR) repeat protein